jgi:hypothetical protein
MHKTTIIKIKDRHFEIKRLLMIKQLDKNEIQKRRRIEFQDKK